MVLRWTKPLTTLALHAIRAGKKKIKTKQNKTKERSFCAAEPLIPPLCPTAGSWAVIIPWPDAVPMLRDRRHFSPAAPPHPRGNPPPPQLHRSALHLTFLAPATMASSDWTPPPPDRLSRLPASQLEPVLKRLLECPDSVLPKLASQTETALRRATPPVATFRDVVDAARRCVDEPRWPLDDLTVLVGGHPRIGAPLSPGSHISEESRKEQLRGGGTDEATLLRTCRFYLSLQPYGVPSSLRTLVGRATGKSSHQVRTGVEG